MYIICLTNMEVSQAISSKMLFYLCNSDLFKINCIIICSRACILDHNIKE